MKGKRLDVLYTDVFTALGRQRQEGHEGQPWQHSETLSINRLTDEVKAYLIKIKNSSPL